MKDSNDFRQIYADGRVLGTKLDVHTRYSSIPTDIPATVAAAIGVPGAADVLDVGCGTGHLLRYLRDLGHAGCLVGLDLSIPDGMDSVGIEFISGEAESLPWPDGGFDAVTAMHMLSHVADPAAVLGEAGRVLRTGGVFVASANSTRSYPHLAEYRNRVHEAYGWGEPAYTTDRVNAENLFGVVAPYWQRTDVRTLTGELRIPAAIYPEYFAAHTAIWAVTPTAAELSGILSRVRGWVDDEAVDGFVIEPKMVAIAVCAMPIVSAPAGHGSTHSRDRATQSQTHGDQRRRE